MRKWIILFLLVGVLVRTWYFLYPLGRSSFLTVDEAVYGVQSLKIVQGERPIFYPAQVYTGSFSAYLSAFLFLILGPSAVWLKLVPFIFSLVFIFLNYILAKKVFREEKYALLALVASSFATPFWNNWSSRAGTGYVEASVLGNIIMILAIDLVSRPIQSKATYLRFFLVGILSGLGFWIQPTAIYYILPALLFLLINYRGLLREKSSYLMVLGFLVGDLPVIIYNLTHNSATTRTLFKLPWGMRSALVKLIFEGMPVVVGVRTSNSTKDFFTPAAYVVELVFALSILYFSFWILNQFRRRNNSDGFRLGPEGLIFLTFFSTLALFLVSTPFNQFSIEPRYIFALNSTLPLILSFFLVNLWNRTKPGLILILCVFLVNWVLGLYSANPLSFNDPYRVENLANYLKDDSINYLISDPALGHRVMFYSGLSVLSAVRGGGITEWRFPEMNQEIISIRDADNFTVSYVSLKDSPFEKDFEREIDNFVGRNYQRIVVDEAFVVLKPVRL